MRRKVKVAFVGAKLQLPAMEVPYPEPLPDVGEIIYNGFTTRGSDAKRVFVPKATCALERHSVGATDPWPYHLRCSNCHAVFGYFDCYTTTGESRVLTMRFCKGCGAEVTDG